MAGPTIFYEPNVDDPETRTRVDFKDDVDPFELLERAAKRFGLPPDVPGSLERYKGLMQRRKIDASPWLKPAKKPRR